MYIIYFSLSGVVTGKFKRKMYSKFKIAIRNSEKLSKNKKSKTKV